ETGLETDVSQKQVIGNGGPDLSEDGVLRGTQEGFEFEVLLNPFEEELDIPAGLIDLGDGGGGEMKEIGQKAVGEAVFLEADQAQRVGIFVAAVETGEF